MNNPLVTVVVPVYNVEKYLNRCIDSIVNQTYNSIEIILVDDGSADNCPALCDEWARKDNRIRVIHQQNSGAGMARNKGIENASGEYLIFVDSDDYIDKKTVEKCMLSIKKTSADVVMFGRCDVSADGKIKETPVVTDKYYFSGNQVKEEILPGLLVHEKGIGISSCNKLFNLKLIKENNIRYKSEREFLSEDALFHLEFFVYAKSVAIIAECLYYYYNNEKSFSRTYKSNLQELNNKFLEKCVSICEKYGYNDKTIDYVRARYHIYAFAGMKQISFSDFSKKQKKVLLYNLLNDEVLHKNITLKSLKPKSFPLKIFFLSVKFRLYPICRILLKFAV